MTTTTGQALKAAVIAGLLLASGHLAAQAKTVKEKPPSGSARPHFQCIGAHHILSEHRRGLNGLETWDETCGKQLARCWIENGQTLCAEKFLNAPAERAPTPPPGNGSAPAPRAPAPTAKLAPPTAPHPVSGATLFDFDPNIVGNITVTHDQEIDRVTIPTELLATATCEVSAGLVDGLRLQRLAARLGKPAASAALAGADFDSRQDAPRILFNVLRADARSSPALRLRVWEHQLHSVACAYDPSPEAGPVFEKAIDRFVSGIRWKSPMAGPSKSELRIASLTGPGMARGASGSPPMKTSTMAGIVCRRDVSVPSTHERTAEQLRLFLMPGAALAQLSIELRTETADAAGRLEVATELWGTHPSTTRRSAVWGVPNSEGLCVASVDGLTMLQKCSRYRGVPTTAQTEARLRNALQHQGAFHFEQDELPGAVGVFEPANAGAVGPFETVRVTYQRNPQDEPSLVRVSAPGSPARLLRLDADGRVVREPDIGIGFALVWTATPTPDAGN